MRRAMERMAGGGKNKNPAWRRALASWQLYALLLPGLAYVFIFSYIPMYGVQIAFKDYRPSLGVWGSEWVGLKHIARFIGFPNFWKILWNTASLGLYSLATFPCAVVFALLINEIASKKLKKTVQMISYAPHFLSVVVVVSLLSMLFRKDTGVVNRLAEALGGARTEFIESAARFGDLYVWSGVWSGIGWGTIIYLAALSGVSPELIEVARVDGASRMRIIWHINLPSIMPTVITLLIMSCGSILSVGFEKVFLMQNPLNLDRSQVIST
ncbi:MAG: ABC transporter permease subunit, partial [Clostridiales bacterium]|nr:ABC transporter permease subunit [Clostridiales bacterium]